MAGLRRTVLCVHPVLIGCAWLAAALPNDSYADPVSVCVETTSACHVAGSKLNVSVSMGESTVRIVGGRLFLSFDPAKLTLINIAPGSLCDPSSPFTAGGVNELDEAAGEILYGVSVGLGGTGALSSTTLACLMFQVDDSDASAVCLTQGEFTTELIDETGVSVEIDSSADCPPSQDPPVISCADYDVSSNCQCPGGSPDCTLLSDDCNTGICDESAGACIAAPTRENEPCDDGIECTESDTCIAGECVGTDCDDPSLCVVHQDACAALGKAFLRVRLGAGEPNIVGGQFTVRYDPAALSFASIAPGAQCDSSSPFALEIFEQVDEPLGEIAYAVGIAPVFYSAGLNGLASVSGVPGPATMACLEFNLLDDSPPDVCLFSGDKEFQTQLVDETGRSVHIDNAEECPASAVTPDLFCEDVPVDQDCPCLTDPPNCEVLTTECQVGVCNESTGDCDLILINEGGPCNDGDACTSGDTCLGGSCIGFDCRNPSLCLAMDTDCIMPMEPALVPIRLGESSSVIVGGQFILQYDPSIVQILDVVPGADCDPTSPFDLELFESIDEIPGETVYGVGVTPGALGTTGPATMACLRLTLEQPLDASLCLLRDMSPFSTIVVDETGEVVTVSNAVDCPTSHPLPAISCEDLCADSPPVPSVRVPSTGGWFLLQLALLLLIAARLRFGLRSRAPTQH